MNFTLLPFEGTDSIKLGMTSSEIKSILEDSPEHVNKSSWNNDMDQFDFVQVEYNADNKSISFEFYSPANVFFNNFQIIEADYFEVKMLFETLDENLIYEEEVGFISTKYQMGIYAPGESSNRIVEAVLVGEESYYDAVVSELQG
ncbi:MAG TPA: hypothetical protein GX396_04645 [Tissierellia bacterium]|nr:hypothetical protein [Tissierellia bacterium]